MRRNERDLFPEANALRSRLGEDGSACLLVPRGLVPKQTHTRIGGLTNMPRFNGLPLLNHHTSCFLQNLQQ